MTLCNFFARGTPTHSWKVCQKKGSLVNKVRKNDSILFLIAEFSDCEFMKIIHVNCSRLNPLTPNSDYQLFSPISITPKTNIEVMRIKEMITSERRS